MDKPISQFEYAIDNHIFEITGDAKHIAGKRPRTDAEEREIRHQNIQHQLDRIVCINPPTKDK